MVADATSSGTVRMLAVVDDGGRLVLPPAAAAGFPDAECFMAICADDRITLFPAPMTAAADAARDRLEAMGIGEADVADAVAWARREARP